MEPNIILIVCDALRKDVLGLYGGPARTPNLKKFAKDAVVYDNCIAPSPWTFPSHVSLFTGLYLSEHGVHESKNAKLMELTPLNKNFKAERLPTYLTKLGYSTIGISNNIMVSRFTNFDNGFNNFFNIETDLMQSKEAKEAMKLGANFMQIVLMLVRKNRLNEIGKYFRELLKIQILSIATNYPFNKGAKLTNEILFSTKLNPQFFLFINFMEMHEPYTRSKGEEGKLILDNFTGIKLINYGKVTKLKQKYIRAAENLDKNLGVLIEMLKDRNLYDNTMIIITSDHGQAFNEHGYMYHDNYLYEEITRIPLLIKYPNNEKFPKRDGYQSLVSIFGLIKNVLIGRDDKVLTKKVVFSESYGCNRNLPLSYKERKKYVEAKYEKLRKAVYKDGFKLTINGTDGSIEEFSEHGIEKNLDRYKTKVKELILEIKKFNKDGNFKFPS